MSRVLRTVALLAAAAAAGATAGELAAKATLERVARGRAAAARGHR